MRRREVRCLARDTVRGWSRAYTLVEVLIVVVILGIAGAMVVPVISSTDTLKVQGAVRMVVADITMAQSDAIAFQRGQAVIFDLSETAPSYSVVEVFGNTIDPTLNTTARRKIGGSEFGFSTFTESTMTNNTLIFDEMGGPVTAAGSSTPSGSSYIEISGSGQRFRIGVEAYTGRVTVTAMH